MDVRTVHKYLQITEEYHEKYLLAADQRDKVLIPYEAFVKDRLSQFQDTTTAHIHCWIKEHHPDFPEVSPQTVYNIVMFISGSRIKEVIHKQIEIFDSTTISLFKDIMKCFGRKPKDGKQKGEINVHTVINVDETVSKLVWFTHSAIHDHILLDKLKMDPNTIYLCIYLIMGTMITMYLKI